MAGRRQRDRAVANALVATPQGRFLGVFQEWCPPLPQSVVFSQNPLLSRREPYDLSGEPHLRWRFIP